MKELEISLRYASKANEALEDNKGLFQYLIQTSSNAYELASDEDGLMDEEQLEAEVTELLVSAGIEEDEFWFN